MRRDVLDWSAKQFPDFAQALRYRLVEQSEHLRERLGERLAEHIAKGRASVHDSLEAAASQAGENLIVFGNEFFDALPVEVIDHRGSVRVGVDGERFVEEFVAPSPKEIEFLDRYSVHPEKGERVEAPLASLAWMERIAKVFEKRRGFVLLIDYGYVREQQLAGRYRDTLMTYRQHRASASPYEAPGEQDITAHVNFTALRERGKELGLDYAGLVTQSQFLLGIGEQTEFADVRGGHAPAGEDQSGSQLKHLISGGMGETFHALVMSRGIEREMSRSLSGLKWAR